MIEPAELRTLWLENADRLVLIARSMGGNAEDAVQEAFVALATEVTVPDDPLAWLVRVTRNRLLQWNRSQKRRVGRESAVSARPWLSDSSVAIDDRLDADAVSAALQKLDSPTREIMVMHLWGEMTFSSIAQVLEISRATAHRNYQYGVDQLRLQFVALDITAD